MKNMRKNKTFTMSLLTALCLAVIPTVALAGEGNGAGCKYKQQGRQIEKLTERLNLSESQVDSVKKVFENTKKGPRCREIDSKKESRKCMKEKRDKIHNEIEGILDNKQKVEFKKLQEEREAQWQEKRAKRGKRAID